ncbi:uncharacterized protein [Triticum aestivum]|uniref:uncharacterized protein n=1 Tax=Triticum aestivum TaxID=4565 RepID=UPI001D03090C|nr:uncharacterized protein LOC123055518 [Triticum aestivum]
MNSISRSGYNDQTSDTTDAGTGASSSMSMAPPLRPSGANKLEPLPMPPSVFSPTHQDSLGFLNQWIAGDEKMLDTLGFLFHADMYANDPYALQQLHPPASARGGLHRFLGESMFQSPCATKTKRADHRVQTGGHWRLEQTREELVLAHESGLKNSFGFYLSTFKKRKTSWLMQEFTNDMDKGPDRKGVPTLHKLYITPRATDDDLREVYGRTA